MSKEVIIGSGIAVQTTGPNPSIPVTDTAHQGEVGFTVRANGSGTWSVTYSISAYTDNGSGIGGNYDTTQILTVTATNTAPSVGIGPFNVIGGKFCAWISALSGTVTASTCSVATNN